MGNGGRNRGESRRTPKAVVICLVLLLAVFAGTLTVLGMMWTGEKTAPASLQEEAEILPQEETAAVLEETEDAIQILTENQEPEDTQEAEENDGPVRLLFGGDVLLSDHVLSAYDKAGGIGGVLGEGFREEIGSSHIFMVNQEFPFSSRGVKAEDKQYTFRLPPEKVSIFQEIGIDIVTLANNHALDFGTDALLDSCSTLDGAGILHVGAGENLEEAKKWETIEVKGKTIGFLGATRVIPVAEWAATKYGAGMLSTYDPAILLEQIAKAKETCDFVVVYVHWGIEREEYPEEYQRTMGKQYIDAGADLVIGSHPHVLQGIEYYQGKPIVYSLGNLIFGSSIPKTMLLRAEWGEEGVTLTAVPGTSGGGYTRELTDEAARQEFFHYLETISFGVSVGEDGRILPQNQ